MLQTILHSRQRWGHHASRFATAEFHSLSLFLRTTPGPDSAGSGSPEAEPEMRIQEHRINEEGSLPEKPVREGIEQGNCGEGAGQGGNLSTAQSCLSHSDAALAHRSHCSWPPSRPESFAPPVRPVICYGLPLPRAGVQLPGQGPPIS